MTKISKFLFLLLTLSVLISCTGRHRPDVESKPVVQESGRTDIFGVTVDSVANLPEITESLSRFRRKPTVRIVFDQTKSAAFYKEPVREIRKVSVVMGSLLDSYFMKNYEAARFTDRAVDYFAELSDELDIWEIGNEINGKWLGPRDVVRNNMITAFEMAKARHKKTALTLYYNESCHTDPHEEVFRWIKEQVPHHMSLKLDYVFLSYYEDDCHGPTPNWKNVFTKLGRAFPNSKLGFGEVGTKIPNLKQRYIDRYYRMRSPHERFVGGYFWWYFNSDMVPSSKPLWSILDEAAQ